MSGDRRSKNTEPKVPGYMIACEYIRRGYRINYSLPRMFFSLFQIHNETVNVWTHLLPAIVIFGLLMSTNLYVEVVHSKGQILAFADRFKQLSHQIYSFQTSNITNHLEENQVDAERQQFDSVVTHYLTPVGDLSSQLQQLLYLTQEEVKSLGMQSATVDLTHKLSIIRSQLDQLVFNISQRSSEEMQENSDIKIMTQLHKQEQSLQLIIQECITLAIKLADSVNPVPKFPMLVFMISMSTCLTCSATYHLLHHFSQPVHKVLCDLDFAGVIIFVIGSSYPILIYGSECHGVYGTTIYLPFITVTGIVLFFALFFGYLRGRHNRHIRNLAFAIFAFFNCVPMAHSLLLQNYYDNLGDPLHFSEFLLRYLSLAPIYLSGVLIMTYKCPERYSPGTFDICGASHQLWHLCVVAGMAITYYTNWDYYYRRRVCPCPV